MTDSDTSAPPVISISPSASPDVDVPPSVSASSSPVEDILAPITEPFTTTRVHASAARDRRLGALMSLGLALIVACAIACAALLATAHARDRFAIDSACASWIGLAWTANHGGLYPALRDDAGNFAGTRYMPLYILAHAGVARATGEYLFSGRIVVYAGAVLWLAAMIALAHGRGSSWLFAAALAASILVSPIGIQALCTIRGDGVALALQLCALWIVSPQANAQTPKRRNAKTSGELRAHPDAAFGRLGVSAYRRFPLSAAVLAGLLCALGFLTKLTAVWAAVAIGLWLLSRDRRALLVFVVSGLLVAGSALLALHAFTDGRMLANFLGVKSIGWSGWSSVALWSPRRMLGFISEWSPTTWLLMPAAALSLLLAASRREINMLHLAWLVCGGLLLIMFADVGVGENHILDLAALTAVLAGDLWGRASRLTIDDCRLTFSSGAVQAETESSIPSHWTLAHMLLAVGVITSSVAVLVQRLAPDVQDAITVLRQGHPLPKHDSHALDAVLAGRTFLSEDALLPVLRDRKPVVLDAFMLRGFEQTQPQWIDQLVARIAQQEFDVIVLQHKAEVATWWYYKLFLGARVVSAIAEHYHIQEEIGGYKIYVRNTPGVS